MARHYRRRKIRHNRKRGRRTHRNPMPLTGALFVTNPRRRRRPVKRHRSVRRNALRLRKNMSNWMKKQYHAWKRGAGKKFRGKLGSRSKFFTSVSKAKSARKAKRSAGKTRRAARRAKHGGLTRRVRRAAARKTARASRPKRTSRKVRRARRKGGVTPAVRTAMAAHMGLKTNRGKRRRSYKFNRGHKRRYTKRRNGLALRTNGISLVAGLPGVSTLTSLAGRFPVIGPILAGAIPIVLTLAIGTQVNKRLVQPYLGPYLPGFLAPAGNTVLGGAALAIAGAVAKFAPLPPLLKKLILAAGSGAALSGVILDLSNFFGSKGFPLLGDDGYEGLAMQGLAMQGLGDGMAYELGGVASMAGTVYSGASYGDAYYSGEDLDSSEGDAALQGQPHWFRIFGAPPRRAAGPASPISHLAGKPGHRWGWVVKLVGWQNFQRIVALDPDKRVAVIHALRQQAIESVPRLVAGPSGVPVNIAAEAAAQNVGGYGALMFAGSGY